MLRGGRGGRGEGEEGGKREEREREEGREGGAHYVGCVVFTKKVDILGTFCYSQICRRDFHSQKAFYLLILDEPDGREMTPPELGQNLEIECCGPHRDRPLRRTPVSLYIDALYTRIRGHSVDGRGPDSRRTTTVESYLVFPSKHISDVNNAIAALPVSVRPLIVGLLSVHNTSLAGLLHLFEFFGLRLAGLGLLVLGRFLVFLYVSRRRGLQLRRFFPCICFGPKSFLSWNDAP